MKLICPLLRVYFLVMTSKMCKLVFCFGFMQPRLVKFDV